VARWNADLGWQQFTHTMARTIPRDLYRSRRMRRALLDTMRKVRK